MNETEGNSRREKDCAVPFCHVDVLSAAYPGSAAALAPTECKTVGKVSTQATTPVSMLLVNCFALPKPTFVLYHFEYTL